jgi:hypothetical protein
MTIAFISKALATGLLAWMALLALLIVMRILRGDINADGMLMYRADEGGFNPERALTMAVFPTIIITYAYSALNMDLSATASLPLRLPEVPESLLSLLIGTNGLYLAGKVARGRNGGASS